MTEPERAVATPAEADQAAPAPAEAQGAATARAEADRAAADLAEADRGAAASGGGLIISEISSSLRAFLRGRLVGH
jgi:glyoxylate carboligase